MASTLQGQVCLEGQLAGCCQPQRGQPIIGYLASKGGIVVHRKGCRTIHQAIQRRPERLLNLAWPS
jgi:GTP pyrophosphokinase